VPLLVLLLVLLLALSGLSPDPSSRAPVPTDEKERFDPTQFQESIVQGLNQSGSDLEAVAKFLDATGGKLDYRRYAETLFDILVAGGMLGEWRWSKVAFTGPWRVTTPYLFVMVCILNYCAMFC